MQPSSSKTVFNSPRLQGLLSIGFPVLLIVAFLSRQFLNFDNLGWTNGFTHPLTGWDHLVTMLAVGVWAAQLRGQAIWQLPLAFVGVMSLGGLVGAAGISIPSLEGIILLSCAVFSLLITRKIRFSGKINVLIVAFFGFFHGFAHGQEISTSASLISYTLGFMLATLLLHGAGILAAKLLVFCVTCLLTMMFSSNALSATDNSLTKKYSENTVFNQKNPNNILPGIHNLSSCKPLINLAEHQLESNDDQGHSSTVEYSNLTLMPVGPKHNYFLDLTVCLSTPGVYPADSSHSILEFKDYYPEINHTPGKRLLSNGVGLTSPPALTMYPLQLSSELHLSSSFSYTDRQPAVCADHVQLDVPPPCRQTNYYDFLSSLSLSWPISPVTYDRIKQFTLTFTPQVNSAAAQFFPRTANLTPLVLKQSLTSTYLSRLLTSLTCSQHGRSSLYI